MDLNPPVPISIARLPTPLEPLERLGADLGVELWVKRDDLTGAALTGNKVRKLEFLAAMALAGGADTLITCGAVTSNHARATAVVAAQLGLSSHLVLRGSPQAVPEGNLLLDRVVGAETTFIPPERWPDRDAIMYELAGEYRTKKRNAYVIPEGGSNHVGSMGYAVAIQELLAQAEDLDVAVGRIVHATGSGGTTAGLAMGVAAAGRPEIDVVGVAVCDDALTFDAKIWSICDAATESGFLSEAARRRTRWRVVEGYKGEGYAKATDDELRHHLGVARREGLLLDPVYSGKAFLGMVEELRAGRLEGDGATIFLHTGGIFGLLDFAEQLAPLL